MFKRHKKKNQKQPQNEGIGKLINELLTAMSFFSLGSMLITFSNRATARSGTVPVYAPKSGLYYDLYTHFGVMMHGVILTISSYINSPYAIGWAIIIVTLIYKFAIMPVNLYLSAQSAIRREKMAYLKPQFDKINREINYRPINNQQRKKLEALKKEVIVQNKVPQHLEIYYIIIGLITSMITIPLYQGVAYSNDMKRATFYAIHLGQRSIAFAFGIALLAGIVSIVRFSGMTDIDREFTPKADFFLSPISLFASAFFLPSILCLYWFCSQVSALFYSILSWHVLKPLIHKNYLNFQKDDIVNVATDARIKEILQ